MNTNYLPYLASTLGAYCSEAGIDSFGESSINENLGLKVLMVSPHPDDETINGALALRLQNNYQCSIFNFPFGFGSDLARQTERKAELIEATNKRKVLSGSRTTAGSTMPAALAPASFVKFKPSLEIADIIPP